MSIQDLIKQLQDMVLIYGDKIILTITDGETEYIIKDITGKPCAQYFEPSDHVSEVIVRINKNESNKGEIKMIQITDTDLPITVAEKIINGVKPFNPTPAIRALSTALTGRESDTQDMFNIEEIKEIADYLMVYYQAHQDSD